MRSLSWMTLVLFIAGCPTPPEEGPSSAPPGGPQPPAGDPAAAGGPTDGGAGAPGSPTPPTAGASSGGILVKVMGTPPKDAPKLSQDQIKAGDHVTISGTLKCEACTEALILRVTEVPEPAAGGEPTPPALVTTATVAAGDFSVVVPKQTDKGLVVEVLADADGSGGPSEGERMVVVPLLEALMPTESRSGLSLDLTDRPIADQGPPAIPATDPNAAPPGPPPEGGPSATPPAPVQPSGG